MAKAHEIVFEDLHGTPEVNSAIVDLDVEENEKGISRVADDEAGGKPPQKREVDATADHDETADGAGGKSLPGQDDEAEGDDGYSEKVRKRIERERKLRRKEQEQVSYWKDQAERSQRELSAARKLSSKDTIEALDTQIKATETEMEVAIEGGKSPDQVKLISRLTDLKAKRYIAEQVGQDDGGSDNQPEGGKVRPSGGPPKLATDWMDERSDWYGKPGFERSTRMANRLDKEIFAEGYDVNDPEYYKELDRRLRKQAPELYDDEPGKRDRDGQRPSGRSPVAPVGGADDSSRRTSGSKVELTSEDFANMRNFGIDTNNPEALKEYARNKREADQEDRRNRAGGRS